MNPSCIDYQVSELKVARRIFKLLFASLCCLLPACGFLDSPTLEIHMMGVYEAPDDAQGDGTPQYQNYTILGFSAFLDGEALNLSEDWEAKEFRIVDRPQRLFIRDIEEFSGGIIANVRVDLDPAIEGGNKEHDLLQASLSSTFVQLAEPFELERGRSYTLLLKVRWKQTIADGQMSEPELLLVRK